MEYNLVAGMDQTTLNGLVNRVYELLYPNIFKETFKVDQMGISTVAIDINQSPTVVLSPSEKARQFILEQLDLKAHELAGHLSVGDKESVAGGAAAASFDISLPSIALTINYSGGEDPTTAQASLSAAISVQTKVESGQGYLIATILTGKLSIPDNPLVEDLLNKAFIPNYLIPYLNENILKPIVVQPLKVESLQISLPVPAVQTPYFSAYSSLGSVQPDVPAPFTWPTNCIYAASDAKVLKAAADIPFPLGPRTGFDWKIISGDVGAQILPPDQVIIDSDGSLTATIVANADAQLTIKLDPLPSFSFGPVATATLTATLKPSVDNGIIELAITGVPIPTFLFSWGSIPGWISKILTPLLDGLAKALNAALGPLIQETLGKLKIPIYNLQPFSIDLAGKMITVTLKDATTAAGGPGNKLLLLKATPTLS